MQLFVKERDIVYGGTHARRKMSPQRRFILNALMNPPFINVGLRGMSEEKIMQCIV